MARLLGDSRARPAEPGRAFNPDRSYTAALLAELDESGDPRPGLGRRPGPAHPGAHRPGAGRRAARAAGHQGGGLRLGLPGRTSTSPGTPEPLPLEEIIERYPGLVEALVRNPGVGFVAAARQFGDAVAIGDDGIRNLITGERGGSRDPLAPFGEPDRWAGELAQLLSFGDSGDLIINGAWLADRQRVVVFEEQTSSHGGLGGPQNQPFLVTPAWWTVGPMDLESPEALHRFLHRALGDYRRRPRRLIRPGVLTGIRPGCRENARPELASLPGPVYILPSDCPVVQRQDS